MYIFICLIIFTTGCSEDINSTNDNVSSPEPTIDYITYDEAFDYISDTEEAIKNANRYSGTNKYGKSATEAIIYSDEYAALYCAYWSALEQIGVPNETRYKKSKLRWDMDFTNKEWRNILIQTYKTKGEDAFFSKYADLYREKVFNVINKNWQK